MRYQKDTLRAGGREYAFYSLGKLPDVKAVRRLPVAHRILLENLIRRAGNSSVTKEMIDALLGRGDRLIEISFMPSRVLLQDFTGVPCAVDLAIMRDAMVKFGGDPSLINPLQPVDLVIDHSVQVDAFGTPGAFAVNAGLEFERNVERYRFLKWSQQAFRNFRVVPPDTGIVHQVNLEYLARGVMTSQAEGETLVYPDTVFGTDSHTTMINGLGILGWGVGGIEAEAAMLGQPGSMLIPPVVGFRLAGRLSPGATATDLVLTVTEMLRKKGVVGKFVEFFGPGMSALSLPDRATIANMSPEYGATAGFFPMDERSIEYLVFTGREPSAVELIEKYYRAQGLFLVNGESGAEFSDTMELDLAGVVPSLAGPKRPQDRVPLARSKAAFRSELEKSGRTPAATVDVASNGVKYTVGDGSVVIAAITSCTNTSNPDVMIAAGVLAKKAVAKGLSTKPWVKTSLAPGSKVVTDYLKAAGLTSALEKLGFHLVGYGCTTCIGNSGPLPEPIAAAVTRNDLTAVAVLSGNRNFEGRINPHVKASYLASPPLVVAYAIAGTMDIDFAAEPLGKGTDGKPVFLKDVWPTPEEVSQSVAASIRPEMFRSVYDRIFDGDDSWRSMPVPGGSLYEWQDDSTYIKPAPFLEAVSIEPAPQHPVRGARVLALLGDSVTTDHISPAGSISAESPAGRYLLERGIAKKDFNSYGSRRGNHEVMMRGTFANIRLRNLMVPGKEGGYTLDAPGGALATIFDAAAAYAKSGTPLIVIAGKEYGSGSSRDWAAKGPRLLGVRAVIAESYERIHRSNLIGMGVLPLEFLPGEDAASNRLTGFETFDIEAVSDRFVHGSRLRVTVHAPGSPARTFETVCRLDTPKETEYYRNDGILPYVLRQLMRGSSVGAPAGNR